MLLISVLMRALHLLAAAIWVGGSVVYLAVIMPALRATKTSAAVGPAIAALFRQLVNGCIGVLLITGAYVTFDRLSSGQAGPLYVGLLAVKLLLAFAMILLAAFQAQEARRSLKHRGRLWQLAPRWILALGVGTFVLGAALAVVFDMNLSR
jgi:uncharacterized membrane protein